ncbi:hypothetical protein BDR26DRAFT_1011874 [Obelidium mucronatum]|nr:hypothetical protein BDR26DRAFT_1011874 [Obelidium mucronatum]
MTCSICFDSMATPDAFALNCLCVNASFHQTCITQWATQLDATALINADPESPNSLEVNLYTAVHLSLGSPTSSTAPLATDSPTTKPRHYPANGRARNAAEIDGLLWVTESKRNRYEKEWIDSNFTNPHVKALYEDTKQEMLGLRNEKQSLVENLGNKKLELMISEQRCINAQVARRLRRIETGEASTLINV